jgi:dihydroneopterin aldolase
MPFFAYHGVFAEEQRLGQRFIVSLTLYVDLQRPGQTDDVADTVNYGSAYDLVKETVEGTRYHLIEALAERLAQEVFGMFPTLRGVQVDVEKPSAPVAGILDTVSITIERWRDANHVSRLSDEEPRL